MGYSRFSSNEHTPTIASHAHNTHEDLCMLFVVMQLSKKDPEEPLQHWLCQHPIQQVEDEFSKL